MEDKIIKILIFLSSLSYLTISLSPLYQFITIASLTWFSSGTIAVAGLCVVATGLPCAGALVGYTVITFLTSYFTTTWSWLETLILTPISLILVLYIAKIARGN